MLTLHCWVEGWTKWLLKSFLAGCFLQFCDCRGCSLVCNTRVLLFSVAASSVLFLGAAFFCWAGCGLVGWVGLFYGWINCCFWFCCVFPGNMLRWLYILLFPLNSLSQPRASGFTFPPICGGAYLWEWAALNKDRGTVLKHQLFKASTEGTSREVLLDVRAPNLSYYCTCFLLTFCNILWRLTEEILILKMDLQKLVTSFKLGYL